MIVSVLIPTPFRHMVGGREALDVTGDCLKEVLEELDRRHPGVRSRLCDDRGTLRPYVNVFVNDEDVRFLRGLDTATSDGDVVSIVPAIAGGV